MKIKPSSISSNGISLYEIESNKLIYSDKDKYEELLKVSNPKKVIENAIKYFNNPNIEIYLSPLKT